MKNNDKTDHLCNATENSISKIFLSHTDNINFCREPHKNSKKSGHLFLMKQKADNKFMLNYIALQGECFNVNSP